MCDLLAFKDLALGRGLAWDILPQVGEVKKSRGLPDMIDVDYTTID